jgi:allantoicase
MMPDVYNPPPFAVDGKTTTRWSSGAPPVGGEWFLVDLGAKATHLTKVVLDTTESTGDFPIAYKLEVSVNGTTFTQVATGAGADTTTINFTDTSARYIKITETSTAVTTHWWSIHELTLTCTP